MTGFRLINGDCIEVMRAAKAESVHAIVCDPPYGIEFMGKTWDAPKRMVGDATGVSGGFQGIPAGVPRPDLDRTDPLLFQQWCEAWGREALRVLKPGGHLLAFGSTRMYHRLAAGIEDAGFDIREQLAWIYSSGMPKGINIANMIDGKDGRTKKGREKSAGRWAGKLAEGAETGQYSTRLTAAGVEPTDHGDEFSPEAEAWREWNSQLKPAMEPIVVAQKACRIPGKRPGTTKKATIAQNVLEHGVGAYHVDACRVGEERMVNPPGMAGWNAYRHEGGYQDTDNVAPSEAEGRYPANVLIDELIGNGTLDPYFFCGKASPEERKAGLGKRCTHPTVKPIELMRWLVRLVTPPGGQVLDPFAGSGTTGIAALLEGFKFVGIEQMPGYLEEARQRIEHYAALAA